MTFALDIIVTVGTLKRLRVDPEDAVVEHVEDVEAGEIAAGVPGTTALDELQEFFAVLDRFPAELGFG
jgi:hypothetical protein